GRGEADEAAVLTGLAGPHVGGADDAAEEDFPHGSAGVTSTGAALLPGRFARLGFGEGGLELVGTGAEDRLPVQLFQLLALGQRFDGSRHLGRGVLAEPKLEDLEDDLLSLLLEPLPQNRRSHQVFPPDPIEALEFGIEQRRENAEERQVVRPLVARPFRPPDPRAACFTASSGGRPCRERGYSVISAGTSS